MIASKLTNYKKLPFQFLRALLFLSLLSLIINADTTVVTAEDQPQHLIIVNEDSMDCDVEKDAKKLIVESLKCEDSNITILSQQKISEEYYVEYPTTMVDVFNDLTISVDVDFKDDLAINLYLLSIIQKSNPNATSISYKSLTNISYQVTYVLDYESPNYNQSIGKYLGAKYTKEDSKAQMSSASLYINGYRLPYLLEDGGEYYLPAYSLQDFRLLNIDTITDTNPKRSFYNIQWKSSKKTNKVIGKIEKTTTTYYEGDKDDYTLFRISNIDYIKVSDLLPKWRNKLTYSTKDNSFYYGTTPSSAESKLKTDVIYNYAVKITKGCTTNKEKVKALHDAIVLRCHYDLKNLSYYNSLEKSII